MIIDAHSHISAPVDLAAYKAGLLASRGSHGRGGVKISDEAMMVALQGEMAGASFGLGHLPYMDLLHHDMHAISPRPFQMMHSEKPSIIVQWFHEEVNNAIHQQTVMLPDHFFGVAGLPQPCGEPLDMAIAELERCVNELGMPGALINPDPFENNGTKAPPMGDRYWYPLYEKLCELDVPGHIHGVGSRAVEREPYTLHFINEETTAVFGLCNSDVYKDFPDLKIIVSHGGGAMPYQVGRFEAPTLRAKARNPEVLLFSERMQKLYYDTTLYTQKAVELLIDVVGVDQCLLGSECPGTGSVDNPATGRKHDDVVSHIKEIDWLSDEDRDKLFYKNAIKVFGLKNVESRLDKAAE